MEWTEWCTEMKEPIMGEHNTHTWRTLKKDIKINKEEIR